MSPQWKVRLLVAGLGVLLLLLALYKAPANGWGMVWVAVLFLTVGPFLASLDAKRPPRPLKQRRLINTSSVVGGLVILYALPELIDGTDVSWDRWSLRLLVFLVVGLITWFATGREDPGLEATGDKTPRSEVPLLGQGESQLASRGEKWLPILWALPLLPGWALSLHNFTHGSHVGVLIMTGALTLMWLCTVIVMMVSRPAPGANRKGARAAVILGHRFARTHQEPRDGFYLLTTCLLFGFTVGTLVAFLNAPDNGGWLTAWSKATATVELVAILSMTGYLRERELEETLT